MLSKQAWMIRYSEKGLEPFNHKNCAETWMMLAASAITQSYISRSGRIYLRPMVPRSCLNANNPVGAIRPQCYRGTETRFLSRSCNRPGCMEMRSLHSPRNEAGRLCPQKSRYRVDPVILVLKRGQLRHQTATSPERRTATAKTQPGRLGR